MFEVKPMNHASLASLVVPVFNDFMKTAVALYGGGRFRVPPGGVFVNIDRFSGQRLPDGATGEYVQAEYFREGEEPLDGYSVILDGGFAMGSNLPLFTRGNEEAANEDQQVITSTGERAVVPGRATFGSLTAGGLY
jgi:penicillin-binding protein 1A